MIDNPPNDVEVVLNHYGSRIPDGVAYAARHYKTGDRSSSYPVRVATLHPTDEQVVYSDSEIQVRKPCRHDGFIACYEQDGETEWWALPEGVLQSLVTRLTSNTPFVLVDHESEHLTTVDDFTASPREVATSDVSPCETSSESSSRGEDDADSRPSEKDDDFEWQEVSA